MRNEQNASLGLMLNIVTSCNSSASKSRIESINTTFTEEGQVSRGMNKKKHRRRKSNTNLPEKKLVDMPCDTSSDQARISESKKVSLADSSHAKGTKLLSLISK